MRTQFVSAKDVEPEKVRRAVEPVEYAHLRLLAGRWHHIPPVTDFSRYVESILIADPKMTTADAYTIAVVKKPDLFKAECQVRDALSHKLKADSVERLSDRDALEAFRGW